MKIIVVSDSHRNLEVLKKIIRKHYDADYYLHAGDSCLPPDAIHPFISVKGNCDFFHYKPNMIIKTGVINIFMTHGHFYLKSRLIASAKANDCKMVIFGHTHIPYYQEQKGIILLNPGSPTKPRGSSRPSYAVINLTPEIEVHFEVLDE